MYRNLNATIPKEKRAEIDKKILHVIANNVPMDKEIIFNSFSGLGGQHGLNFADYSNYHAYSSDKKKMEYGQFFTPFHLSHLLSQIIRPSENDLIADLTAGKGSLLNHYTNPARLYANEWEHSAYIVLSHCFPFINTSNKDIREYEPQLLFDHIVGNPPFNLKWRVQGKEYTSQLYYIIKSAQLLKNGGLLSLIVPKSFLADDFYNRTDIETVNDLFNHIVNVEFEGNQFDNATIETKLIILQRKSKHVAEQLYNNDNKLIANQINDVIADHIHATYIAPITVQREQLNAKITLEMAQSNKASSEFNFKLKKYLHDIKHHKNTKKSYPKAIGYYEKFLTQTQPDGMSYEEWSKTRITENKVIAYLKRILKNQHNDKKLKGETNKVKNPYNSRAYKSQREPFNTMEIDAAIDKFLREFTITDFNENRYIKLNEIQLHDTNLLLQKRYSYLQWGTGSGKSISTIAQLQYRFAHNQIRNAFIVAPAIAINNNWDDILNAYGYDFIRINKLSDVQNIKRGQIVIMTFHALNKYQRQIKRYLKAISNKAMIVLDEADSITNIKSKRTQAFVKTFMQCHYKLLCSATSTRNNINEAFTAFNFLYGSSINFVSDNRFIYIENRLTKELEEKENKNYSKPFPSYTKGLTLFKQSFNPSKASVFGVEKLDQSVYNSDHLKSLIDKTFITRSFEEVSGKKLYNIVQKQATFSEEEKSLYRTVLEEFYRLSHYYRSSGNSRKDAMLKIINQLNAMLKSCTLPNHFKEYRGGAPSKLDSLIEMCNEWKDDIIVIGATNIKVVEYYSSQLSKWTDRKIFTITGNENTLNQRKKIIEELRETGNGILICTQQSLSSSMNIDFVNRIILLQLQWNFASMQQFIGRFIRYTSTEQKDIHFLTIANSIESNLLNLILNKEKLNLFMKNDDVDSDELLQRFGMDSSLFDQLLTREMDNEGKYQIIWNESKIN